jgi:hypothetical protein
MAFTSGIWAFWIGIGTKHCSFPTTDDNVDKGQNSGNPVRKQWPTIEKFHFTL